MAKENISKVKREPTIWENVFAHDISNKGFISKYIKNSHDPTSETQPNYKMGKGPEQTILQGGHREGPETYERMLSITSHQREMQINTTMRHHITPVRMAIINKLTTSAGEDVEKRELYCTVGGNADWCRHCGK